MRGLYRSKVRNLHQAKKSVSTRRHYAKMNVCFVAVLALATLATRVLSQGPTNLIDSLTIMDFKDVDDIDKQGDELDDDLSSEL